MWTSAFDAIGMHLLRERLEENRTEGSNVVIIVIVDFHFIVVRIAERIVNDLDGIRAEGCNIGFGKDCCPGTVIRRGARDHNFRGVYRK